MTLIIILIALIAERLAAQSNHWQAQQYVGQYWRTMSGKLQQQQSPTTLFFLMFGPAILVAIALAILNVRLIDFVLAIFVLLVAIGHSASRARYRKYLNALSRDDAQAMDILKCELDRQTTDLSDENSQVEPTQRTIGEILIWINFKYYAAPIFYFVILGIPGVIAYSLLLYTVEEHCHDSEQHTQSMLSQWLEWAYWLPARLVSLGFMVVGNFNNGLETWLKSATDFSISSRQVVCQVARESDGHQDDKDNAQRMVKLTKRNVIFFLVVVAILTLFGHIR